MTTIGTFHLTFAMDDAYECCDRQMKIYIRISLQNDDFKIYKKDYNFYISINLFLYKNLFIFR